MGETTSWAEDIQHLQARLNELAHHQIQSWAARWDHLLAMRADEWRRVGHVWKEIDIAGYGPIISLVPKDPHAMLEDQRAAIVTLERTRDWLAANPVEEVEARLQHWAEAARDALQLPPQEPLVATDVDFWEPTFAEQVAYEERPYERLEAQAHGDEGEGPRIFPGDIVLDTSNPQMEDGFQALLTRLDASMNALVQEPDVETQQLQQRPRLRY